MPSLLAFNAQPLAQISLGHASISGSYALVGTFTAALEMMFIVSTLDDAVILSFDGTTANFTVPAGNTVPVLIPLNFKANRMTLPTPTVYVKQVTGVSTGSIFISGFSALLQ